MNSGFFHSKFFWECSLKNFLNISFIILQSKIWNLKITHVSYINTIKFCCVQSIWKELYLLQVLSFPGRKSHCDWLFVDSPTFLCGSREGRRAAKQQLNATWRSWLLVYQASWSQTWRNQRWLSREPARVTNLFYFFKFFKFLEGSVPLEIGVKYLRKHQTVEETFLIQTFYYLLLFHLEANLNFKSSRHFWSCWGGFFLLFCDQFVVPWFWNQIILVLFWSQLLVLSGLGLDW